MKIALVSAQFINGDTKYNLSQMEHYLIEAKKQSAHLVCFGESFLQGFDCFTWRFEDDKNIAISTNSSLFTEVCNMSLQHKIDILFGYMEIDGEAIYSSCALISNGKLCHNYRRISKGWKEYTKTDEHYCEGDTVEVFDYNGRSCVLALCGDLWDYPERFALGEDLLLWLCYVSWTADQWENEQKNNYALQAGKCCTHTLYVNSICQGDALGGVVFFEKGLVKHELPMGNEGLLLVEL